jgi:hypothetical protein
VTHIAEDRDLEVRETRRVSRNMSPSLKNIGLQLKCGGKNVNVKLLVYK